MASTSTKLMYLSKDYWSPRYDETFYSIQFESNQRLDTSPVDVPPEMGGKTNHPAFYYQIHVFRGQTKHTILRRYSHFQWLYQQIQDSLQTLQEQDDLMNAELPPGTCPLHFQSDDFAKNRQKGLETFLKDLLDKSHFSSHPAVLVFLQLQQLK